MSAAREGERTRSIARATRHDERMNGQAAAIDRAVASRQSVGSAWTLPCSRGGGFRVQLVVTSRGAFGQPCEGSTRNTAAPRRTPSRRGLPCAWQARGLVDGMCRSGFASRYCRKRCTRVRGYRRSMTVELSYDSFVDFRTWFSRTQWENVASRRRGSVQGTEKRFCGDRGERRAYILNRE